MSSQKISPSAVGRIAKFGDLYNARKDEFLGTNAFKKPIEEGDTDEDEIGQLNLDYVETDSICEEFEKSGIDRELALSILCGVVNLDDSESYLNSTTSSKPSQKMTLLYTFLTKKETVESIRSMVDTEVLNNHDATHIVIGISWGIKCNIICWHEGDGKIEEIDVTRRLKAEMEKLKAALLGESTAKEEYNKTGGDDNVNLSYRIYCSITNQRTGTLQSLKDV